MYLQRSSALLIAVLWSGKNSVGIISSINLSQSATIVPVLGVQDIHVLHMYATRWICTNDFSKYFLVQLHAVIKTK